MIRAHLIGFLLGLRAQAELFWLACILPLLPAFGLILQGRENRTEYAGMGEPISTCSVGPPTGFLVDGYVSSGAIAFNASSPVTTVLTIPTQAGVQPFCKRGEWRLRITGVDANTFIGLILITVDDGTNVCMVGAVPAMAAGQKGFQVDIKGRVPPIDNASNFGSASDGMPTNIINVKSIVAFTTTDGSGNSIGDIALEWRGNP